LHLKDDALELADEHRLRNLVTKYSDHIELPVRMQRVEKDQEGNEQIHWESANSATALWVRSMSEVSDEEYKNFY
ncbi:molecular chaperone HtpG, partial [Cobetia marina]